MTDTATLKISHVCARNLGQTSTEGVADHSAYVVFEPGNQKVESSVAKLVGSDQIFYDHLELLISTSEEIGDLQIKVYNKATLLPDHLVATAELPLSNVHLGKHIHSRVQLKGPKYGPSDAGELAFTMEKHGQGHPVGSYDDTGLPLAAPGALEEPQTGVYEKTEPVPATGGVGGGGAAVYSEHGVKSGPEFDPQQLSGGTRTAGTHEHHEQIFDDHGHHVKATAGVAGGGAGVYAVDGVHTGKQFDNPDLGGGGTLEGATRATRNTTTGSSATDPVHDITNRASQVQTEKGTGVGAVGGGELVQPQTVGNSGVTTPSEGHHVAHETPYTGAYHPQPTPGLGHGGAGFHAPSHIAVTTDNKSTDTGGKRPLTERAKDATSKTLGTLGAGLTGMADNLKNR